LSWIEYLATNQAVGSSNLSGRAIFQGPSTLPSTVFFLPRAPHASHGPARGLVDAARAHGPHASHFRAGARRYPRHATKPAGLARKQHQWRSLRSDDSLLQAGNPHVRPPAHVRARSTIAAARPGDHDCTRKRLRSTALAATCHPRLDAGHAADAADRRRVPHGPARGHRESRSHRTTGARSGRAGDPDQPLASPSTGTAAVLARTRGHADRSRAPPATRCQRSGNGSTPPPCLAALAPCTCTPRPAPPLPATSRPMDGRRTQHTRTSWRGGVTAQRRDNVGRRAGTAGRAHALPSPPCVAPSVT